MKLYKIFKVGANLAALEDIFRGHDLAFIILILLQRTVPPHMEIHLSRHQGIRPCNIYFFILKFPATSSINWISEIFLAVPSRRCVPLLVYIFQTANRCFVVGLTIDVPVSVLCFCPVIDHKFRHNIVKDDVDP